MLDDQIFKNRKRTVLFFLKTVQNNFKWKIKLLRKCQICNSRTPLLLRTKIPKFICTWDYAKSTITGYLSLILCFLSSIVIMLILFFLQIGLHKIQCFIIYKGLFVIFLFLINLTPAKCFVLNNLSFCF